MNTNLLKLIERAREAIDRGDMYVGHITEFGGDLYLMARLMEIPVGVFGDKVLLKLRKPRVGVNRNGQEVKIVSRHDGVYYDLVGNTYREKDLAWTQEKELP